MPLLKPLFCAAALTLTAGISGLCQADDYTNNWESVPNETFNDATNWNNADYIRSHTTYDTTNNSLSSVIEDYKLGNDGFMYVAVVENSTLLGYFRFPYTYDPATNGGAPDPFGTLGGNNGIFDPPGGSDWYSSNNGYSDIPAVPEAETYLMLLTGIGLTAFAVRRKRRTHLDAGA